MSEFSTTGVRPDDILAGKYRVERIIGEGGMGVVVVAYHLQLDERVAIKFLRPEALANAEAVGRFAREARAAVKIKSEHVARVIDVGELASGSPYMVMEYLEGSDLSSLLGERGPMPSEVVAGYVLQACEALAEAHVLGIVHRDLKPANLFLANRPSGPPSIKVLDFGISKSAASMNQAQLTRTSAVMGSPLYMSPEQMQSSKSVDVRSDIWALGVVMHELLAGSAPFRADTFPELVVAIIQREPAPLSESAVPGGLRAVVHRCLAKDPAARFANVGELAAALAPFGPPRSDMSVERIHHVLGSTPLRDSGPPLAVISNPRGLAVSSGASTMPASSPFGAGAAHTTGGRATGPGVTAQPVSSDAALTAGLPRRVSPAAVLAAVLVVGVAGGLLAWNQSATHASSTGASLTDLTPTPIPLSPQPVAVAASSSASNEPAAVSSTVATSSSVSPPPSRSSASEKVPSPGAAHASVAPTPTHKNCTPPYTFDSAGHRQYKPECFDSK